MKWNKVRTRRTTRATVAIAALALVLAACGDSEGADTVDEGAKLDGEPIKIGFAVSLTGPQSSSTAGSAPAAQAWAQQTNADGGINGRPVEIVVVDTKNNASAAQAAAKKLVEDEDIVAMMVTDSVAEGAVGEYLQGEDIPVIGSGGYNQDVWNKLPSFLTQSPNSLVVIQSLLTAAVASDASEFAAAVCAESATCAEGADAVFGPGTEAAGLGYGGYVKVTTSAANYTAECLSFNEKDADYIAVLVPVDTAVRVMSDCVQQGYEGAFATSSTSFNPTKYGEIPGMNMIGTLNGFPWWADDPQVQRFRDAMDKYESDTDIASTSTTTVWTSLELFKKALGADTDTVTRDSVFASYYALKDETLDGLLPQPITYTEGQPAPVVNCFWQYDFTAGDENPELLPPTGESGNGASGDLATACTPAA